MNQRQLVRLFVLLLAVVLVSACGSQQSPVSHGGPVTDYVTLVDSLRAAGATVDPAGTISQPFFTPQGQLIAVNDQQVQVFEFASAAKAEAGAGTVSADGSSVGTTMMTWVATPHFYRAGKVIALYVGDDSSVVSLLEEAMGSQFAGR
jgi:hypothetical protein